MALKIVGLLARANIAIDLSTLLFTENEQILVEAQERVLKSDLTHTWDHFTQLFSDLRKGQLFNRT